MSRSTRSAHAHTPSNPIRSNLIQPAARRAIMDFERSERERIHFETATRVMNYEIKAQREAAMAAGEDTEVSPLEAKRLRRLALNNDSKGELEITVRNRPTSHVSLIYALYYFSWTDERNLSSCFGSRRLETAAVEFTSLRPSIRMQP